MQNDSVGRSRSSSFRLRRGNFAAARLLATIAVSFPLWVGMSVAYSGLQAAAQAAIEDRAPIENCTALMLHRGTGKTGAAPCSRLSFEFKQGENSGRQDRASRLDEVTAAAEAGEDAPLVEPSGLITGSTR